MTNIRKQSWSGRLSLVAALGLGLWSTQAADWPQWRGPDRQGVVKAADLNLSKLTPQAQATWKSEIGAGYASMAISGGKLYGFGNKDEQDMVTCLDAKTGTQIWQHKYACRRDFGGYKGPRSTPAVAGQAVFTFSGLGQVHALDKDKGTVLWQRDLKADMKAGAPQWGFASSPLVVDKLLYLNVGAAGLALDTATGKTVWDSGASGAGYASPVLFDLAGKPALAIFAGKALVVVDPATGKEFWRHPWETKYDVNAADPVIRGNKVFLSSNYGRGGAMLEISATGAKVLWDNKVMKNHFNMSVAKDNLIFGNSEGTLVCMDAVTGTEKWQRSGFGRGHSVLLVGDKLVVLSERGQLSVSPATADGFQPEVSATLLGGQCWTVPAVADGRIYIRNNDPGQLICVDLN